MEVRFEAASGHYSAHVRSAPQSRPIIGSTLTTAPDPTRPLGHFNSTTAVLT